MIAVSPPADDAFDEHEEYQTSPVNEEKNYSVAVAINLNPMINVIVVHEPWTAPAFDVPDEKGNGERNEETK